MAGPGETVLIIPLRLPPGLEAMRRRLVPGATTGLRAHATVLPVFARPGDLDDAARSKLQRVISAHAAFSCRLVRQDRWPGVLFASVEPEEPFGRLNAALLAAFPEASNGEFEFSPHVTIALGPAASDPDTTGDPAWLELPKTCRASRVDLIVGSQTGWDLMWSFAMGAGPAADDRRRP